ncbi:phosphoribosyltransferase [Candidatus Woesearchaeota archaeon]|nr:phosphoribosyltransferase [Candidatus Woesearchaeota archaeon]
MFRNRTHAGQLLAKKLFLLKEPGNTLILGIPRGGVKVAYEVAKEFGMKMDVLVVRKLGYPNNEELAIGAVGAGEAYLNDQLIRETGLSRTFLDTKIRMKQEEVRRRYELFRGKRTMYSVTGKTVIMIDDGAATGSTLILALRLLRKQGPKRLIVAIPVAPAETVKKLEREADLVICLEQPTLFSAIGQFYDDFTQVEDYMVKECLK